MPTAAPAMQKEQVTFSFYLPKFMKTAGMKGGVGMITGMVFNIIHPISGALFASTQSVMKELLKPGVKKLLTDENNLPSKIYVYVVIFLFSTVVSISMTISLGFPMNFPAAIWLSLFMVPTSYVIEYLFLNMISSKMVG